MCAKVSFKMHSFSLPSGTVVDTDIVHPRNNDFFMCAHAGMIVSYSNPFFHQGFPRFCPTYSGV